MRRRLARWFLTMARMRTVKPGLFSNDVLAEIEPLGRLLFIGLWTIADREGRLEDRPKRIKAEVLPYDSAEIEPLLQELHRRGFITRYQVSGSGYIQINNFTKHQSPHVKETESTIPPLTEADAIVDGDVKQALNEHQTSTGQACKPVLTEPPFNSNYNNNRNNIQTSSGASAPLEVSVGNLEKAPSVIWDLGVRMLVAAGDKEPNARSYLGKLVKDYGAQVLAAAVAQTSAANPVNPKEYLSKVLSNGTKSNGKLNPNRGKTAPEGGASVLDQFRPANSL